MDAHAYLLPTAARFWLDLHSRKSATIIASPSNNTDPVDSMSTKGLCSWNNFLLTQIRKMLSSVQRDSLQIAPSITITASCWRFIEELLEDGALEERSKFTCRPGQVRSGTKLVVSRILARAERRYQTYIAHGDCRVDATRVSTKVLQGRQKMHCTTRTLYMSRRYCYDMVERVRENCRMQWKACRSGRSGYL